MKFGSKGMEASTIIGIIVAVLVAAVILYILWIKGMLPFNLGITEAECLTYFTKSCQQGQKFSDNLKTIACRATARKFKGYDGCFGTGSTVGCEEFCKMEQV